MTVKRYTPTQCCEHDGTYVTYSDYQKLVTENSELKGLIEMHAGSFAVCPNCSHEEPSETDDIVALYRSTETPATDAAIAEIKAQGVDEFKDWNDTHIEIGDEYEDILREVSKACSILAANLRAGSKG